MEHIQATIPTAPQSQAAALWQSIYVRFVLILLSGFTLANIGVTILAQSTASASTPTNPFLEYANLFPGQPMSPIEGKGFSCWNDYNYGGASEPACKFTPLSGAFSNIDIFTSAGRIRRITFTLRDNRLRMGDLVLLFGKPDFRTYPHHVFFFWNDLFVHGSTIDSGNAVPMRPVGTVTFTHI